MSRLEHIPTNIITGFLGVGKTTAINALLAQKPANEIWAVLVNEFGQIGIDQAALPTDSPDLFIKELAGGCICCALGPVLNTSLAQLLRRARPDRLLIEPTGIGHPAGIIDILQGEQFRQVIDLRSVICLLDPRSLEQPDLVSQPTFQDQINLADVLVLNKTDLASAEQLAFAQNRAEQLFPPKQAVLSSLQGGIPLEMLDLVRSGQLASAFPHAHQSTAPVTDISGSLPETQTATTPLFSLAPHPGHPLSKTGSANGLHSCGWVFSAQDTFVKASLINRLQQLTESHPAQIQRIKGVFHTEQGWMFYNQVLNEHSCSGIAYRRDSRLEIISTIALDWTAIEQALLGCRLAGQ